MRPQPARPAGAAFITMKYLSVCSGIEAATVAWHHMGWEAAGYAEIEPFPSAVLAHHYPNTPNLGDMQHHGSWEIPSIDLLVGGTPCQSFSVAGLRRGLSDPRGGLMLTYLEIARDRRPRWIVWENVPGVLSSNGGRDFGAFLGALGELGYGWAYRVLDAQWFGVAQRRRRVFVVGYLGDSRRAAAVLFERESVRRNPPPRREKGQETSSHAGRCAADGEFNESNAVMGPITTGASKGNRGPIVTDCQSPVTDHASHAYRMVAFGAYQEDGTASSLKARDYKNATDLFVAGTLGRRGLRSHTEIDGHGAYIPVSFAKTHKPVSDTDAEIWTSVDASPTITHWHRDRSDIGTNVAVTQPVAFHPTQDPISSDDGTTHAMGCGSKQGTATVAVAFEPGSISRLAAHGESGISPTLRAHMGDNQPAVRTFMQSGNSMPAVTQPMSVRRLTPRECERLQGFPDDYTDIKPKGKDTPDGPRYKALGNSMAVPVMRWIGERINAQESL